MVFYIIGLLHNIHIATVLSIHTSVKVAEKITKCYELKNHKNIKIPRINSKTVFGYFGRCRLGYKYPW